jgi:hypothetical protein
LDPFSLEDLPNAPINPTIGRVDCSYFAMAGYTVGESNHEGTFLQLEPFGYRLVKKIEESGLVLAGQKANALYLGFAELSAWSQISMLIQLRPSSGNSRLPLPTVSWSILRENAWQDFQPSQIVHDGTEGLRKSGIVVFNLGELPKGAESSMPAGYVWLRAVTDGNADAFDQISDIYTNAIHATLSENPFQIQSLLPANSIGRATQYIPGLQSVTQPYPSFGGALPESTSSFQSRVAERLRHKQRSISLWDYEKIVLAHFPEVHQVQCINHCAPEVFPATEGELLNVDQELAPGHVTVVCIPKTANPLSSNPLQPVCRRDLLADVQARLQAEVPPFITIHAVDPRYLEIQVSGKVVFRPMQASGWKCCRPPLHDIYAPGPLTKARRSILEARCIGHN